jgi:hypothetical protein
MVRKSHIQVINPESRVEELANQLADLGVNLNERVRLDIIKTLTLHEYINKHCCFIIDAKSKEIIAYDFNIYFKTEVFPFSIHAEVKACTKLLKSKRINKSKKFLYVAKISATGKLSGSKCCIDCMRYVRNLMDILNIKKVINSTKEGGIECWTKKELLDEHFRPSKGALARKNAAKPK